jgi:hypothetical protein
MTEKNAGRSTAFQDAEYAERYAESSAKRNRKIARMFTKWLAQQGFEIQMLMVDDPFENARVAVNSGPGDASPSRFLEETLSPAHSLLVTHG